MTIWVIADTHFGHKNILNFKDRNGDRIRKFWSIDEMDEVMVERWNNLVEKTDKVYHLGDVFFGDKNRAGDILARLNGKKRLVVGNHDNLKEPLLHKYFQKITMWRKLDNYLLTHVPVHESVLGEGRFKGRRMINVHGHIHQNPAPTERHRCVSVEHTNYSPVALDF